MAEITNSPEPSPRHERGALSRRVALSVAIASVPSIAGAVSISTAEQPASEHPADTVRRLTSELAKVLNEYEGGRWFVQVYPSQREKLPIHITNIEFHEAALMKGAVQQRAMRSQAASELAAVKALIGKHRKAIAEFGRACDSIDTPSPSAGAKSRWHRMSANESTTLMALCSYRTESRDAVAERASYLSARQVFGLMDEEHFDALLASMARTADGRGSSPHQAEG